MYALDLLDIELLDGSRFSPTEIPLITDAKLFSNVILRQNQNRIMQDLEILMPCDVNNPLLGPNGAAFVFGPQKGAKPQDLPRLDMYMEQIMKFYLKARY